jgi:hypothetical protein
MSHYAQEEFTDAFIEAALWAEMDDEDEPLDANYTADDFDSASMEQMKDDAMMFLEMNYDLLERASRNDQKTFREMGVDFWLTMNGHGAGFWDGDYPETGDEITAVIKKEWPEQNLYVGDDGQIYVSMFS